jgi:hypothetical protein
MKVTVTKITGFAEAFETMFISKRSWTPELGEEIRCVCEIVESYKTGRVPQQEYDEVIGKFEKWLGMLLRMGRKHITVLRFIDITIVTEGLHRGGQDDVDAHARRFDNRIIRNSTRLATFDEDEMSDYYRGKILTTGSMLKRLAIDIPDKVYEMSDGYFYSENDYETNQEEFTEGNVTVVNVWVRAANGYILEEYKDNKDVKRGLYPLSIPSNFISKINLCEWGHVFGERNQDGGANPEVKDWAEMVTTAITEVYPQITREYVLSIEN